MLVFVFHLNVNFDQIWKNQKFQMFANFRMIILPKVAWFGLILMKPFLSTIFHEKRSRFTFLKPINGQIYSKIQNSRKFADDHKLGTEHAIV